MATLAGAARASARGLLLVPKIAVGTLVLLAISVMLYGVFARYILLPITDWFDLDPVNFFWVEEVGETTLAWLTLIGAAVAVAERAHFTLTVLVHRLSVSAQRIIHVFNYGLIAAFGAIIAWLGVKLAILNSMLTSPALEFSLAWLYAAAAAGGVLIVIYALANLSPATPDHTITDVRE